MQGRIIFEDGTSFNGKMLTQNTVCAQVVFNTSMSGYQEIFTDPSYEGQMVCMTYPLIGNYGIFSEDSESSYVHVSGIIIGELYDGPIHPKATESLKEFLIRQNVPTITGVDCRAITRHIRSKGSLKAIITNKELTDSQMESFFCSYLDEDVIKRVQKNTTINDNQNDLHIALIDYGAKKSIKDYLEKNGATVSIVSNNISKEEFDSYKFDGAVLSNGPGDPQKAKDSFELINHVQTKYPTFGICLGHQILGLVNGAKTYKMKFGHRGSNHSVKDLMSGKVYLSSQNHSYAIDNESLKGTKLEPTFLNINDNTIEGFKHKNFPVFSVQFHPEANSGPNDTSFLFNTFLDSVRNK